MTALAKEPSSATKEIRLLDGRRITFDMRGPNSIHSDITSLQFDFSWCRPDIVWHQSLVSILLGMLSTHSSVYARSCAYYSGRFAVNLSTQDGGAPSTLKLAHFEPWIAEYGASSWPFMRAVLGRCVQANFPGFDEDIAQFLETPDKWEQDGNGWYFALLANDPERGAFTEQELKSIQDAVNRGYETGIISLADWALVWFLMGTGVRPIQVARMTVGDVIVTGGPEGKEITLCIPLAKGENTVVKDRWKRKAPTVLAEVLLRYLETEKFKRKSPEAPLFADQSEIIRVRVKETFARVETYSARLERRIPIFPYRFRYTLGTRAIALGASDHEAARLLTHRGTHCIQYYRAAMPALQKPIKDALGPEMAFIAQAFQGRLIGGLDEATRRGEATALIRDFAHLMGKSIGACGTRAECHQDAPRACLGCRKFEPFIGAPWEDLLAVLTEDMETETEDRIKLITLEQIDAVRGIILSRNAAGGPSK